MYMYGSCICTTKGRYAENDCIQRTSDTSRKPVSNNAVGYVGSFVKGKKHLVILPWSTVKGKFGDVVSYEVGNFAVNHGMTINFFPLARTDMEAISENDGEYIRALKAGEDCSEYMYILGTREKGQELGLDVYKIDGCYVGIKNQ